MENKRFIHKAIRILKGGRINLLLFGGFYYLISNKNRFLEKVKFNKIQSKNISKKYLIEVNGSRMSIDFKDKGLSKELCVHKKREVFTTDFMQKIIKEDDLVLDIGANRGYYALLEAKIAQKGKVYATEPVPSNYENLKENVLLNNYKNIKLFHYAVGNINGKGKMNVCDKANWCSFTKNPDSNILGEISVPLITLDEFIAKELANKVPSLIRMDVEGYECQIVKGMSNLLKSKKPTKILMELHPYWLNLMSRKEMNEMIETLRNNGFNIKSIILEVAPYNYKNIRLINMLRKIFWLPQFGFAGRSYKELYGLLSKEDIYTPQVLFERV